jgi:decaprenylphospho-beta-D-ribofuranose 2-oxidase
MKNALLISNWGNYPRVKARNWDFQSPEELKKILTEDNFKFCIPRGNGRCYGDSALSANIVSTLNYRSVVSFDEVNGIFACQSGMLFDEIIKIVLPKGWFLPVTPGTKFVTVGGAIASDIHGKNHHKEGSFSNHVISLQLMLEDGAILNCSRSENADLFFATAGGMGLTGIILSAEFRLKKIETSFISQESIRARNLDHLMDLFEESRDWTYSVSWVDALSKGSSLGRGIFFRGEHASVEELQDRQQAKDYLLVEEKKSIAVPFYFPAWTLNSLSVSLFNFYFFHKHGRETKKDIVYFDSFFYPMDSILHWNRIYGKPGFLEYQFVLPKESSRSGLNEIFHTISKSKLSPFFSGLKLFGKSNSFLSFPIEGYTMAFDFPITKKVFELLDLLDAIVLNFGGRVYLTKDARMNQEFFKSSYSQYGEFKSVMEQYNPSKKYSSTQSQRIGITP